MNDLAASETPKGSRRLTDPSGADNEHGIKICNPRAEGDVRPKEFTKLYGQKSKGESLRQSSKMRAMQEYGWYFCCYY